MSFVRPTGRSSQLQSLITIFEMATGTVIPEFMIHQAEEIMASREFSDNTDDDSYDSTESFSDSDDEILSDGETPYVKYCKLLRLVGENDDSDDDLSENEWTMMESATNNLWK